jgi:cell cycle checkpoint protein
LQKSSQRQTGRLLAGSQKLVRGPTESRRVAGDRGGTHSLALDSREKIQDSRPWVDKYAPRTIDELAVHPKKVEDVRRWILETFAGRSQKVIPHFR